MFFSTPAIATGRISGSAECTPSLIKQRKKKVVVGDYAVTASIFGQPDFMFFCCLVECGSLLFEIPTPDLLEPRKEFCNREAEPIGNDLQIQKTNVSPALLDFHNVRSAKPQFFCHDSLAPAFPFS
jgi:hypothetical protein